MDARITSTSITADKKNTPFLFTRPALTRSLGVLALQLLPFSLTVAAPTPTLTLLTWEDYIESGLVADFEQQHQVRVKQVYFDADSERDELLGLYGPEGYDLIMVDTVSIPVYEQLGWITSLAEQQAELQLPLPRFRQAASVCAPYYWGTTGIAYRADLVDEPITSWSQLFKPDPALQGRILMPREADETVGLALKALGYSLASSDKDELKEARQLLIRQAPSVMEYSAVATDVHESRLVTGDAVALVTYNSDALMLKEVEPEITYVLPDEGGAIWADFWCQSAKSSQPDLARKFLEFINTAENTARNTEYIYGATPNKAALNLLPTEILSDPLIFPDKERLSRSEPYQMLPPRVRKKYNHIMNELIELKTGEKSVSRK